MKISHPSTMHVSTLERGAPCACWTLTCLLPLFLSRCSSPSFIQQLLTFCLRLLFSGVLPRNLVTDLFSLVLLSICLFLNGPSRHLFEEASSPNPLSGISPFLWLVVVSPWAPFKKWQKRHRRSIMKYSLCSNLHWYLVRQSKWLNYFCHYIINFKY